MITTLKNFIVSVLMVSVMAPFLYLGVAPAQKAEAQGGLIIGGVTGAMACVFSGYIESFFDDMFSSGMLGDMGGFAVDAVPVDETNPELLGDIQSTAESTANALFKECVLDPIMWVIKRVLIDVLTKEILDWIDDGFDNAPVFMTDLDVFFRNLANATLAVFLHESELAEWVCEPFQADVFRYVEEWAVQPTYGLTGYSVCQLEEMLGASGVGMDAGYDALVNDGYVNIGGGIMSAMALLPDANNGYGSIFNVQEEAAYRIAKVSAIEAQYLDYSDGYFSDRCNFNDSEWRVVCTPGQLISKQIDDYLGGGLGQLEVADEVAEVLGELLASLVVSIFSNDEHNGLLSSGTGEGSFDTGDTSTVTSGDTSAPTPFTYPPPQERPEPVTPPLPEEYTGPAPEGEWVWLPDGTEEESPNGAEG